MILIPGELIALLTFPGVILHELSHNLACKLAGVEVYKVCYFRFENPMGYVLHEPPAYIYQSFVITFAPIILGYACAAVVILLANDLFSGVLWYIGMWVAFSISMNALSSDEDINNLWAISRNSCILLEYEGQYYQVEVEAPVMWRMISTPIGAIVKILNALRPFWIDVVISILLILWII